MTEENQDSDSLRREPTAELARQRRDAWRARYDAEHAKYLVECKKVRRLEREAAIAEDNREILEILRQQHQLVHGYWLDVRAQNVHLQSVIEDYENRISWNTTCQQCANTLDRAIEDHERAERAEAEVVRLRALIADQIGVMGQEMQGGASST